MPNCGAVYGCYSNYRNNNGITFHRCPKNDEVKKKWISLCRRQDPINGNRAVICSLHFDPNAYERDLKYELLNLPVPEHLVRIKEGALPTTAADNTRWEHNLLDITHYYTVRGHSIFKSTTILIQAELSGVNRSARQILYSNRKPPNDWYNFSHTNNIFLQLLCEGKERQEL